MDREKLIKILSLTTSETDGEALAAIRMANKMLSAEKLTWGDVLKAGGTTINISLGRQRPDARPYEGEAADWTPPHLTDRVLIEAMFRTVYAQPRTEHDFWLWLDSVHQQWLDRGRLTPEQFQGLRRSHARAVLKPA